MFQEEGLYGGKYATRPTLILEYRIVHLLVEVEALRPRRVETSFLISKEKLLDPLGVLWGQISQLTRR